MADYKVDLKKLHECVEQDYRAMHPYRSNVYMFASEVAGSHYSDGAGERPENPENPVNLLSMYQKIILAKMISGDPRVLVSTGDRAIRHFARPMEQWINKELKRTRFKSKVDRWAMDALYLMGILKVSIVAPTEDRFGGFVKKTGSIGIQNINFHDFVWDMRANCPEECWYMGHMYTALYDEVKNTKVFSAKARKGIKAMDEPVLTMGGDDRIGLIGRSGQVNNHTYHDYVELCELYLPMENIVVTYDPWGDLDEPLLVQKFVGQEHPCGPYRFLMFGNVHGQLMPKSPFMDQFDTHKSFNEHWKKLDNQAADAKTMCFYKDEEAAANIQSGKDGAYVRVQNPKEVGEVVVKSGPNQQVSIWAQMTKDLNFMTGGNLEVVGGLGSQADTATQEKLVAQSSSEVVNSMSNKLFAGVQEVVEAVGWYGWHNPKIVMKSRWSPPGDPGFTQTQEKTPMDRFGVPYEELDLRLDTYSFVAPTPQSKLMVIEKTVKELIIPLLPMYGQPGVGDFLVANVRTIARLTNTEELEELLEKLVGVEAPVEQEVRGEPTTPAETTRTYERISRPGMNQEAHNQVLAQLMAGGEPGAPGAGGLGQMTRVA